MEINMRSLLFALTLFAVQVASSQLSNDTEALEIYDCPSVTESQSAWTERTHSLTFPLEEATQSESMLSIALRKLIVAGVKKPFTDLVGELVSHGTGKIFGLFLSVITEAQAVGNPGRSSVILVDSQGPVKNVKVNKEYFIFCSVDQGDECWLPTKLTVQRDSRTDVAAPTMWKTVVSIPVLSDAEALSLVCKGGLLIAIRQSFKFDKHGKYRIGYGPLMNGSGGDDRRIHSTILIVKNGMDEELPEGQQGKSNSDLFNGVTDLDLKEKVIGKWKIEYRLHGTRWESFDVAGEFVEFFPNGKVISSVNSYNRTKKQHVGSWYLDGEYLMMCEGAQIRKIPFFLDSAGLWEIEKVKLKKLE